MPRPITGDEGRHRPATRREPPPPPDTTPAPRRDPDQDSRGHDLAMQLPDWDLVPPTEFLDRVRGR